MSLLYIFSNYIEAKTKQLEYIQPDPPTFSWKLLNSKKNSTAIILRVDWIPNTNGIPGANFFVKYREKGKQIWLETNQTITDYSMIIHDLRLNDTFELVVVSVDGDYTAESEIQEVEIKKIGNI